MGIPTVVAADDGAFDEIIAAVRSFSDSFHIVGRVEPVRRALDLTRRSRPRLLLLALQAPYERSLDVVRAVREELPSNAVVMCRREDAGWAVEALRQGAAAYVFQDTEPEEVARILRAAVRAQGGRYAIFSPPRRAGIPAGA